MKYQTSIFAVCVALLLALPAFTQAPAPPKPADKAPESEPPPVLAVPQGYRYDSAGRRDPFSNPIPKPEPQDAAAVIPVVRPPGLPGLLLAETKLSGIVKSAEPGMTKAVIAGPGGKIFFATRGDSLFDAVIKEIRTDAVVFSVLSPTTRQPLDKEVVRSVSTPSGEKK